MRGSASCGALGSVTQEIPGLVRALTRWEAARTPPSRTVSPKDYSAVPRGLGDDSTKGFSSSKMPWLTLWLVRGKLPEPASHFFSCFYFYKEWRWFSQLGFQISSPPLFFFFARGVCVAGEELASASH